MAKAKFTLNDYEIMKKREEGETIANIAEEAGVSYGAMQRKLQNLPVEKPKIQLYDILGDGNGGIYTVIEIGAKVFTIKNNVTLKTATISKRLFNSGETMYHKLNTPPVTVYNLNDQEPKQHRKNRKNRELRKKQKTLSTNGQKHTNDPKSAATFCR